MANSFSTGIGRNVYDSSAWGPDKYTSSTGLGETAVRSSRPNLLVPTAPNTYVGEVFSGTPQFSEEFQKKLDAWNSKIGAKSSEEEATLVGPSRGVSNALTLGSLGLGALSFLDNKKTAGLQRQALRADITAAADQNQRRKDVRASWNSGWVGKG